MSERSDLHGKGAPPHAIEHAGKTYLVPHALDVGDLLEIEELLFRRACDTLALQKSAMDPDDYRAELRRLAERYEAGEFGFEQPAIQATLKTRRGAMLFLSHVLKVPEAELMDLLVHKGDELLALLQMVTRATFPDSPEPPGAPKAAARPGRGTRRRA